MDYASAAATSSRIRCSRRRMQPISAWTRSSERSATAMRSSTTASSADGGRRNGPHLADRRFHRMRDDGDGLPPARLDVVFDGTDNVANGGTAHTVGLRDRRIRLAGTGANVDREPLGHRDLVLLGHR